MSTIIRAAGLVGVVAGVLILIFGALGSMSAYGASAWPSIYFGASAIVSGAVLYCFGAIVDLLKSADDQLRAIRAALEAQKPRAEVSAPRTPSRPPVETSGLSPIFRDR